VTEDVTARQKARFPRISPRAYEHPVDRGALATLRAVPGFAQVLRALAGAFSERGLRLTALASAIRVGPAQYPQLDELRTECAAALDLEQAPELYVTRDPAAAAYTVGMDKPFIVITTGMVELLDADGLRFVVGHEMGHVLSGHAVYRTMLMYVLNAQRSLSWNPLSALGLRAIGAALNEWYRKSELSCDRAGLLCGQDPEAALRVHVRLAGGTGSAEIDTAAFLRQAEEYSSTGDLRDSLHKLLTVENMSHPLAVVRAAELQKWAASQEYRDILGGNYPRRDDDEPASSWREDVKAAARAYKESVTESTDPLAKVFSDVGAAISGAASKVRDRFVRGEKDEADTGR